MVTHTPSHRHPASGWMASLSLTYGISNAVFALPNHLARHGVKDTRRSHDPTSQLMPLLEFLQPATIHRPISPLPPRRCARSPRPASRLYMDLSIQARVLLFPRSFRVTSQAHLPIGCNQICNTLHLLRVNRHPHGLRDLPTTRTHTSGVPHQLGPPHHSPSGGGRPSSQRVPEFLKYDPEKGPLLTPPPISTIGDWAQMLLTHTHEEFATLVTLQKTTHVPHTWTCQGWRSSAHPKYNTMTTGMARHSGNSRVSRRYLQSTSA